MALDLSELVFHLGTQPVKFDPVFVALQLTAYPCPDRAAIAAESADIMIVIISPLIHVVTV